MTIEDLHSALNAANGVDSTTRLDSARAKRETAKGENTPGTSTAASSKSYQVDISPEGKSLSSIESDLRLIGAEIRQQPEARLDRVEEAKRRLHEGYYGSEKAITRTTDKIAADSLAEAMLAVASIKKKLSRLANDVSDTDPARIELASRRVRDGFYHTPAGINAVIDKILL